MSLDAECLADPAALPGLAPEWRDLWRRAKGTTPFQSPDWLLPWWAEFGTARPRVALLRGADGRLCGVLPLYDQSGTLRPLGVGLTDLQDALLAPDAPPDAADALLRAALDGVALPCELTDLPPGAALRHAAAPPGWRSHLTPSDPCPVLTDAAVPARQARKLRMARHRAERAGGWRLAWDTATLADVMALHAASWMARGEPGVLADPHVAAFLHSAVPALAAQGALRLPAILLGTRLAAAAIVLPARNRLLLWLGGWDPELAWHSPGTLLIGALIEHAAAEGRREVHFLRGQEGYKHAWGATDRSNATRRLERA